MGMIITNISECRRAMSPKGWALFCEHSRNDRESPFDPEALPEHEEVCLSRVEVLQYEYDPHNASESAASPSP